MKGKQTKNSVEPTKLDLTLCNAILQDVLGNPNKT